ncbi:MAG: hypothetical protein BGN85_00430 [Alphaproteobacteria bacterium 64-11]|nr:MAG: hypothetical protein BGN85_00430 [Alphaproteobacteria bacterium 64-11]
MRTFFSIREARDNKWGSRPDTYHDLCFAAAHARKREILNFFLGQSAERAGSGLQYATEKNLRMDFGVQTKFNSP